jgi:hypothetical protein
VSFLAKGPVVKARYFRRRSVGLGKHSSTFKEGLVVKSQKWRVP